MKRAWLVIGLLFLAGILGGFACAPDEPSPACDLGYKEGVGTYLVDAGGMTLYYSLEDTPGTADAPPQSSYSGKSREQWRPFYTEELVLPYYLNRDDFTVFTRSDGTKQLAYAGWLLYYYSGDRKPGDTLGEGVGGVWHYVNT